MIYAALFYLTAGFTVLCALGVALSQNVVYAAFALMGTLVGAAGIYAFLAADFVAVVQVLVYVGGILVLTLFAIMLTHQISDINVSNRSVGWAPRSISGPRRRRRDVLRRDFRRLVYRTSGGSRTDDLQCGRGISRKVFAAV